MEEDLRNFLELFDPAVQALILSTRELIQTVLPDLIEMVDTPSKIIAYGTNRGYSGLICAIAPHKSHVNLMFARGAQMPDAAGLLEGTGKKARHIKIRNQTDLERQAVRDYLKAAAA